MTLVIHPGRYCLESPVGDLHVDVPLNQEQIASLVSAMKKHGVSLDQITEADISAQGTVTLRGYEFTDGRHVVTEDGDLVEREWT